LFVAGALLAGGFLLKQPAAIAFIPLAVYALHCDGARSRLSESMRQLASLCVGFSVILIAVAIWLVSRGLLGDAFYSTITNHAVPKFYWVKGLENTLAFTAFCLPLTGGAWLGFSAAGLWTETRSERNALVALVVMSLIGVGSSGRFYPHYYIAVIPPCA